MKKLILKYTTTVVIFKYAHKFFPSKSGAYFPFP